MNRIGSKIIFFNGLTVSWSAGGWISSLNYCYFSFKRYMLVFYYSNHTIDAVLSLFVAGILKNITKSIITGVAPEDYALSPPHLSYHLWKNINSQLIWLYILLFLALFFFLSFLCRGRLCRPSAILKGGSHEAEEYGEERYADTVIVAKAILWRYKGSVLHLNSTILEVIIFSCSLLFAQSYT